MPFVSLSSLFMPLGHGVQLSGQHSSANSPRCPFPRQFRIVWEPQHRAQCCSTGVFHMLLISCLPCFNFKSLEVVFSCPIELLSSEPWKKPGCGGSAGHQCCHPQGSQASFGWLCGHSQLEKSQFNHGCVVLKMFFDALGLTVHSASPF